MTTEEHTVGFPQEWKAFYSRHPLWAEKCKLLISSLSKVFIREFSIRSPADKVVFFLGRLCVEDFNEAFLLCANGYGFGGLKIVRGLYERAITGGYIAKYPKGADSFLEYHFIHKGKMLNHAKNFPGINEQIPKDEIEETNRLYSEFKAKFKEPLCKKCGTFRTQFSWSKLDTASMAQEIGLEALYFPGYFYPTLQTHATPSSLMARLIVHDDVNASFDERAQQDWADRALIVAHNIIIRVLMVQNSYFKLQIDKEIEERKNDFVSIWGRQKAFDLENKI
ncbi:hypothetical protein KKA69_05305 [Patescibacteria group bacterium]|nr:hypothetical protein [Patescibacteria group bacterium]